MTSRLVKFTMELFTFFVELFIFFGEDTVKAIQQNMCLLHMQNLDANHSLNM